jgi:predicted alpha/beta superfamily hydrolase
MPRIGLTAFLVVLAVIGAVMTAAELVTLPRTEVRRIESKINGVPYAIYVSLPPGYESEERHYPVVYLLDAGYSFAIAHNVVEHLVERRHLDPLILVAIAYDGPLQYRLNRTRDYTPSRTLDGGYGPEYQRHSGGGPKFFRFITEELIPLVEANYRASTRRALVGHSYGGLFGAWVMLSSPGVFDGFILVSPSLWYHDSMMLGLGAKRPLAGKVYLAVGASENPVMAGDLGRFAARLRKDHPKLRVRREVLEGETHNSVFPSGFSRGIRWVFDRR